MTPMPIQLPNKSQSHGHNILKDIIQASNSVVPNQNQYGRNCTDRSRQRSRPYGIRTVTDDSSPLPMSLIDRRAIEDRYVEYHKHNPPSPDPDWERDVLGECFAENGEPDPLWPLVWILDHRAVNVEPDVEIESSERCVEGIDPEILAKAREGAGTIVYWIIPDGQRTVTKLELVAA
ncbi:hypothetical protein ARMGADRAFT_1146912 [Armillaria gallica]|uniref:Uncharacterized protein n=1 Tax=Armillaria gallica TaxID=47427 RepID=A0A2H3CVU4_ARMGA|nr:hypothetical protein ARMGADRAFT_1146912 [Armillaria gallica]